MRCSGAVLATGHAVDVVVEDNGGHVNIAPAGMNEMIAADGGGITITHGYDNLEFFVGQF